MWWTYISHSVANQHVRGNNEIHCVADPQVMEMQATNSPVSYGCLTVDEDKSFKSIPIYSVKLRYCSVIMPLYPVIQSTCKQIILLEYKIERNSTTTKNYVFDSTLPQKE